ncbi:MAG: curli production assembly/transport component CsgF [Nonlabens ulvanivorans]|uniref:Curli production assembly/transport component CsgF n=2 Tax=Nonlabens ulvanivorans TaxID=906888 RepID=A0A084JXB8_NONUL|nr:curli production assembly/transport component CsgF [Nonlabens ulvanivorans]KEZ93602.1 curli assembly protein CsgF [Nonlabens ulvanivorans]PRX14187.1 curli production assembly/transport component CsgF [Nonlabens ulvanivorans]WOI23264.1 curli assembly protein CsgF [Nonlabens ulvanivorans]GAK76083.1 curli production assembly/transport componentCsgF [Nonlabens ulvanivorans]
MLTKSTTLLSLLFLVLAYTACNAQQFTYKPINPAFGGDTFNYQWLIQSAEAQNRFTDPAESAIDDTSELDAFTDGLNRQLLSGFSRQILNLQLGEEELRPGVFTIGSYEVEVLESLEGLVVNLLDTNTGDQTQIIIPNN